MKALIIGGGGFVGRYLAEHLLQDCGWETIVTKLPKETVEVEGCEAYNLDILDKDAVEALLVRHKPDAILHLAAQSSVAYSWKNPQLTADINIHGCLNVLDAVRDIPDYSPKILLIGSGEEYGILPANTSLVSETTPVHPANPYAITKMAQNLFGALYAKAYEMHVMMVRAFNHIGPNQTPMFVVADFCQQAAEIEAGKREAVMRVGNLSAKRDFTDVRDVIRAYALIMEHGKAGETYNVGSGHAVSIQQILDTIVSFSKADIKVEVDPAKLRPVDVPIIEADIRKLVECTGWKREIPLERTIEETLDYWRKEVK